MKDFVVELAKEAGQVLMDHFERRLAVETKSSEIDLVTEADVASEKLIVEAIRERYPEHGILSEEGLGKEQAGEFLWLVDPLDGTVNYAHGYPVFCVSIALQREGQTVLGVIYNPVGDELFCAEKDQGAYCNKRRLSVSGVVGLRRSLLATGFPYARASIEDNNLAEFGRVMPRVQGVRRGGAATLDMAYVAAGRLDGYWEFHLSPWDWAAGDLLVREAGGRTSDVSGQPWRLRSNNMVATNGLLHEELLATLRGNPLQL
jgi:myo-inositol-1(or 4)-monophosphatase